MKARIAELRDKQVVSIKDASVVGHVYDIEFDTETGSLCSIVVTGKGNRQRFHFNIFGRIFAKSKEKKRCFKRSVLRRLNSF